jgi:cell division protein FtsB
MREYTPIGIVVDSFLLVILLTLLFDLLFGVRSLSYYTQLKGEAAHLHQLVEQLKIQNSNLRAKYLELKTLESEE